MGGKSRVWYFVTCDCGKRGYMSRSVARRAAQHIDKTLRPYLCDLTNYWHLGHLPNSIRQGRRTRDEVYPKPREGES